MTHLSTPSPCLPLSPHLSVHLLSCSDLMSDFCVMGCMQASSTPCHNHPSCRCSGMSEVCLDGVHARVLMSGSEGVRVGLGGGGCSVLRIRPQKMLIRVDLGTWSVLLMDRVQGQTSPRGAMILSLIVHTCTLTFLTPSPPTPLTLH